MTNMQKWILAALAVSVALFCLLETDEEQQVDKPVTLAGTERLS